MRVRLHNWLGVSACLIPLLVAGCGGLQEVWEGPGAKMFRPQAIAVLPPMASQYDSAREDIQDVLSGALTLYSNDAQRMDRYPLLDLSDVTKRSFEHLP